MTSIIRSPAAIVVACVFTFVTAFVLLEDVFRHGAPITSKHLMVATLIGGTVFFGHVLSREFWAGRIFNAFGCLVLFLVGSMACVLMSAGRNAEAITNKAVSATTHNGERERAVKNLAETKGRYDAALVAERDECGSGDGTKCQSKRVLRKLRREELDVAEALLKVQPAPEVAHADIKAQAALISRLPYVTASEESLEALLLLVQPFLLSLFCEVGAIIGFGIGLGEPKTVRVREKPFVNGQEPFAPVRVYNPDAWDREAALADLLEYIAKHGSVPSQMFLQDRWGLRSKGTVSTWLGAWERRGLIARQSDGRVKLTSAPS